GRHVLGWRVHVSDRMHREPRTFRSDATACSSACFQAPEATTGPAPVSVATDWTPLRFPRRRLRRESERFRDESDWNMDRVFHHSVALDAIMMGGVMMLGCCGFGGRAACNGTRARLCSAACSTVTAAS